MTEETKAEELINTNDVVIGEVQHYHLAADKEGNAVMVPVPPPRGDETFEEMDAIAAQQLEALPAPPPKLSPAELEAFNPKCAYCGGPIDHDRARKRKKTCSDEHTRLYNQYRRYQWSMTRCPSCYRPSTPEERKEFKAWRAHRGDVLKTVGRGRPSKTREHQLVESINALAKRLEADSRTAEDASLAGYVRDIAGSLRSIVTPE